MIPIFQLRTIRILSPACNLLRLGGHLALIFLPALN